MPEPASAPLPPEPPGLRNLRRLVTLLTATLILGVASIVVLLFLRLNAATGVAPLDLPETVALPAGETAMALTGGEGWIAVVTRDRDGRERIRVLDAVTGAERAVTEIAR